MTLQETLEQLTRPGERFEIEERDIGGAPAPPDLAARGAGLHVFANTRGGPLFRAWYPPSVSTDRHCRAASRRRPRCPRPRVWSHR